MQKSIVFYLFFILILCLNNIAAQDIKFFNQRPIKNVFIGIGGDGVWDPLTKKIKINVI